MGVIGMNLTDGDEVVGMQMESQGDSLMIVSEKGLGKCTLISEFTTQNRGGKGVKCYKITEKTGNIVGVKAVNHDNEIMLITTEGIIIRIKVADTGTSWTYYLRCQADQSGRECDCGKHCEGARK